jgi:hypothetical protein
VNRLVESARQLKIDIETYCGATLKVDFSPSGTAIDTTKLSQLPTLILQGPNLKQLKDFEIVSIKKGEAEGIDIRTSKKSRMFYDMTFRLRFFHNSLLESLKWLQKFAEMSQELIKIDLTRSETSILFSGDNPVKITIPDHELSTGDSIIVSASSKTSALANGTYVVTFVNSDNVTVAFDGTGSGGSCTVTYVIDEHSVEIDGDFDGDTIPNFSDLKHYEGSATIEHIKIESTEGQDVFVIQQALQLESEKI